VKPGLRAIKAPKGLEGHPVLKAWLVSIPIREKLVTRVPWVMPLSLEKQELMVLMVKWVPQERTVLKEKQEKAVVIRAHLVIKVPRDSKGTKVVKVPLPRQWQQLSNKRNMI